MTPQYTIHTERLVLIAATVEHMSAEIEESGDLAYLLNARVPDNWPPEMLRDALPTFLKALKDSPGCVGWNAWYWVLRGTDTEPAVLIGSGGFKAVPDENGQVEIGYGVLSQYQGQGYATEAAGALVKWALDHPEITRVVGETDPSNKPSIRVLEKLGFRQIGPGTEPGCVRWRRDVGMSGFIGAKRVPRSE